jgi:hypothetical protein
MCKHEELLMEVHNSISIHRSMSEVFEFMSDMRNHPQEEGSNVLLVKKVTEGEIGTGTQFREMVRMFPLLNVSFFNEITQYEPDEQIEITWRGAGMEGILRFSFENYEDGTVIMLHETVTPRGVMKLFRSVVGKNFMDTWEKRLRGIQYFLETGV